MKYMPRKLTNKNVSMEMDRIEYKRSSFFIKKRIKTKTIQELRKEKAW